MGLVKANRSVDEHAPAQAEDLSAALTDADATTRRRAARALGERREGADLLCTRLEAEPDAAVRSAIAAALLRQPSPDVARHLVGLLRSEEAAVRNQAIELLAAMPEAVAPLIEGILNDPDSDIRIFGVNVLASLASPEVPGWLIALIEHEPHVNVCAAAVDVLAEVGAPDALPALRRLAVRFAGEAFLRFSIQVAIDRIGLE